LTPIQVLPASLDAERLVLGAAIMDSATFWPAIQDLPMLCFSVEAHRVIYAVCHDIHKRGDVIDRATTAHELNRQGKLADVGGLSYLLTLDEGMPRLPNVDQYVAIVQREARRREIHANAYNIHVEAGKPSTELSELEASVRRLREGAELESPTGLVGIIEAVEAEGGLNALLGGDQRRVIPTPFPVLTGALAGGFRPGQLVIIGARPGHGKSIIGKQFALSAAEAGNHSSIFSLEMSTAEMLIRAACCLSGVPIHVARTGEASKEQRKDMGRALAALAKQPLKISDRAALTPAALSAQLRYQKAREGADLAVVDYLGLMSAGTNSDNRTAEISYITRHLKLIAKELSICLVVLSQLNRASATDKRRPGLHDLRDSGSIEQDADIVMFLHPIPETCNTDLILAKQRNGWTGTIPLAFDGACVRFLPN
jgi:replicative DNA helicase